MNNMLYKVLEYFLVNYQYLCLFMNSLPDCSLHKDTDHVLFLNAVYITNTL